MMQITHLSQLPEWAKRNHTTASQKFFMDLLNIHDRPENQGLETPSEVEAIRLLKEIHATTTKAESWLHGLANVFKFGAGEAEKTYPSKRR